MYKAVLVDDEPIIVNGLMEALDWEGYDIEIAYHTTSATAALQYILEHPVHVVITDVSMPDMDGLTLTRCIKEAKPSVYVLILSAYNNFDYVKAALRYGAENYLLKPLDTNELSDSISQIIGSLHTREQLNGDYSRAAMTFRNSFVEQWIKKLLTDEDLSTKADMLGINLEAPLYSVVIFTFRNRNEASMALFLDFFLQHILGSFTANFYFDTPFRLVCVLSPVKEHVTPFRDTLPELLEKARHSGLSLFVITGPDVENYTEVSLSYNAARALEFMEYTKCLHLQATACADLDSSLQQILALQGSEPNSVTAAMKPLYARYGCENVGYALMSRALFHLCPEPEELPDRCPEMVNFLGNLDQSSFSSDPDSVIHDFLTLADKLSLVSATACSPMIDVVIHAIQSFSDKNLSLKTIAARLNVSPSYLGAMFRQQTGMYFNDYLAKARIDYAMKLLSTTDLKVKDIVEKCCFASQTYFNRSFKRFYGTSPANYRRNLKMRDLEENSDQ